MKKYFKFLKGETQMNRLRRFNFIMGILHLVQAFAMLFLSVAVIQKIAEFQPQIVQFYITYNPVTQALEVVSKNLFLLPFGLMVRPFSIYLSRGSRPYFYS